MPTIINGTDNSATTPAFTGTDTDTGVFFPAANQVALATNGATAVTVDASQNVGIGTSSPSQKLDVANAMQISFGGSNTYCYFQSTNNYVGRNTSGDMWLNTANAQNISFGVGGTEKMRLDSSGNLLLGYGGASPTSATAPQGLSLASPASTALQIYMFKLTQVEAHIGFKSSTDTNFYVGTSGGGGPGGIGAYGLYQVNTSTAWTAVSDERFKTELQPIENALSKIDNVRAVTGRYTYDEENGVTRRRSFLIAQDFVNALPEAVDTQDPEKLGLSYSDTIPLLFAAIKELNAKVEAQAATIATLQAKLGA